MNTAGMASTALVSGAFERCDPFAPASAAAPGGPGIRPCGPSGSGPLAPGSTAGVD